MTDRLKGNGHLRTNLVVGEASVRPKTTDSTRNGGSGRGGLEVVRGATTGQSVNKASGVDTDKGGVVRPVRDPRLRVQTSRTPQHLYISCLVVVLTRGHYTYRSKVLSGSGWG